MHFKVAVRNFHALNVTMHADCERITDVIWVVMRAFCVCKMNWAAALWVALCKQPSKGRYKTWTLDYGLNFGLDYGLDYGPNRTANSQCFIC